VPLGLPHGVVFAGFMVCTMIGSKLFELIVAVRPVEHGMRWVFVVASAALAMPILTSNASLLLAGFCVFEVCCGIYWPGSGTMRSKYIQEEVRSTVMNVFRIGLNLIVVIVLINIERIGTDTIFLLCTMLLTVATLSQHRLFVLSEQNHSQVERSKAGLDVGEEMDEMCVLRCLLAWGTWAIQWRGAAPPSFFLTLPSSLSLCHPPPHSSLALVVQAQNKRGREPIN
jgi:hypothetical protein